MKILTILVVENAYLGTAREAFSGSRHRFLFAKNDEEAWGFPVRSMDGIITDLFFPSEMNWPNYWHDHLINSPLYQKLSRAEKEQLCEPRLFTESPSGLALAKTCIEHSIPFVVVAAGDLNYGNMGLLHNILPYLSPLNLDNEFDWENNPPDGPKDRVETWQNALKKLEAKIEK